MQIFEREYEGATIDLKYRSNFELLVAVMLSAQSTDKQVNKVTPALFEKYRSVEDFANANQSELERDIFSTGFYRNKAKGIVGAAKTVIELHGGEVPSTLEELTALPGVGRKTANVVLGHAFGIPAIAVDTHVKRIANLLRFTNSKNPEIIERDLERIAPEEYKISMTHYIIRHGRKICVARKPKCEDCLISDLCPSSRVK